MQIFFYIFKKYLFTYVYMLLRDVINMTREWIQEFDAHFAPWW